VLLCVVSILYLNDAEISKTMQSMMMHFVRLLVLVVEGCQIVNGNMTSSTLCTYYTNIVMYVHILGDVRPYVHILGLVHGATSRIVTATKRRRR
jgi:hypothetical protein